MTAPPKRHLLRGHRTVCGVLPKMSAVSSLTVLPERVSCARCLRLLDLERTREATR